MSQQRLGNGEMGREGRGRASGEYRGLFRAGPVEKYIYRYREHKTAKHESDPVIIGSARKIGAKSAKKNLPHNNAAGGFFQQTD